MNDYHSYQKMQGLVSLMSLYGFSMVKENQDGEHVCQMILEYDPFDVIVSLGYESDHLMFWIDGNKETIGSGNRPAHVHDHTSLVKFVHGEVMNLFTVDGPSNVC